MSKPICFQVPLSLLLGILALFSQANAQGGRPLLKIERLRAELESQSNAMSIGRNSYDAGLNGSQQMDIRQYPNSTTCLVVYDDGKYFFEKKEEHGGGRVKAKSAGGVLSADDLQHLKSMLDDDALRQIPMPKSIEVPPDAQVLKEAERLDVQVARGAGLQQFTFMKERVKTGAGTQGNASGTMSGMDVFLDNEEPYKKTVSPLMKWFDEIGKKEKLKESKPQYCQ